MKSHQYPTFDEAISHLNQLGTLEYHGRAGRDYEYGVYTLIQGGRRYYIDVYLDGKVIVKD